MIVGYAIDGNDFLTEVSEGWVEFATSNDAPELAIPPGDRTIWSYVADDALAELWRLVIQRARQAQRPINVTFRCDAPGMRRWFLMRIAADADGTVRFRSSLTREQPRAPVVLLDRLASRDAKAQRIPVCAWCARCREGAVWVEVEDYLRRHSHLESEPVPRVSHGICPPCADQVRADLCST